MDLVKVRLRKDKNYVYCYLKEDIILDEDCDCYEQNCKVDNNWVKDIRGRTHRRSSNAGYEYAYKAGTVLNSCDYCLKEEEQYEEFLLPEKASKMYRLKYGSGNTSNIFNKINEWIFK